jgi:TolA-binding protein
MSVRSAANSQALRSLALGLFIASVATAGIELSRWRPHAKRTLNAGRTSAPSLANDQRLVPVTHEPTSSEAHTKNTPRLPLQLPRILATPAASGTSAALAMSAQSVNAPSVSNAVPASSAPALDAGAYHSAADLFLAAQRARERGDVAGALELSRQIETFFPNSEQGIRSHLSLGVLYLEIGNAAQALDEFKIYRHIGASELMAEALWGEAEANQALKQATEERAALQELLHNYPRSVYTAAARQRLAALP